jgi:glucose/mannose-6-phosphate isomerase
VTPTQYLDSLGMWEATAGLPEQGMAALGASADVLDGAALPPPRDISAVAIFGLGGSAAAADVVAAYGAARATTPIWVGKGAPPPAFVGPGTLVFALSYSGLTAETRAAAAAAADRGAHVVVVSGGGPLVEMAAAAELTRFDVAPGLPACRAALGGLAVPVLLTLSRLGIVPDVAPSLSAAFASLQRRRDLFVAAGSEPERVARLIGRTIPLVYGSIGLPAVAARRWKTQVNVNAKSPAFCAVAPELCHDEIAGWGQHGDVTRQVLTLVTLRHVGEDAEVARRFELIVETTDEVMAHIVPIWAEGDDDLSRFFDLALFGDFVSLHMAGREGVDPGPAPAVGDAVTAAPG